MRSLVVLFSNPRAHAPTTKQTPSGCCPHRICILQIKNRDQKNQCSTWKAHLHVTSTQVDMVVFEPTFNHNYKHLSLQTPSTCWIVDLTATIIPPVGAICGVETNDAWILVESLCMSDCILQIFSHALALKFSRSCCIVTTNTTEPKKSYYNNCNHFQLNLAI